MKYIESSIDFGLENPSISKEVNYTTKLQITSERNAYELSFHELTGDFMNGQMLFIKVSRNPLIRK